LQVDYFAVSILLVVDLSYRLLYDICTTNRSKWRLGFSRGIH